MDQVIVITGTSRGIGRYLGEYYLNKGCAVAGCSRNEQTIRHEKYRHYRLDVCNEQAVSSMIRDVRDVHGKIDVLLNNAGVMSTNALVVTNYESAKQVMNINLMGTFLFTREAGKAMIRNRKGRIVNFSTLAVPLCLDGGSMYAASKSAVESLTRTSAKELSQYNITVNALGPAIVKTDILNKTPESAINAIIQKQAITRAGSMEDIANVVNFFIDEKSDFITGQIIYLGGIW